MNSSPPWASRVAANPAAAVSTLDGCIVEYGGSAGGANVLVEDAGAEIRNSLVRRSGWSGRSTPFLGSPTTTTGKRRRWRCCLDAVTIAVAKP